MAKSIKRPVVGTAAESLGVEKKALVPKQPVITKVFDYTERSISIITGATDLIKTIGEERRKNEALRLEGVKIRANIENQISERENETMRILKNAEIELKKIDADIEKMRMVNKVELKNIDRQMKKDEYEHIQKMKILSIIEKSLKTLINQYELYKKPVNIDGHTINITPFEYMEKINKSMIELTNNLTKINNANLQIDSK